MTRKAENCRKRSSYVKTTFYVVVFYFNFDDNFAFLLVFWLPDSTAVLPVGQTIFEAATSLIGSRHYSNRPFHGRFYSSKNAASILCIKMFINLSADLQ